MVVTSVITVSTAGLSYVAFQPDDFERTAHVVADQVSCRTVDAAIVAYVADWGGPPQSIAELTGYVKGDISAYRVGGGVAVGPGC